jgi:AcrR family transcriptional regulator
MPPVEPSRTSAGRPRSDALDEAILRAAFAELGRVGYRGLTMEGVAAAAGTTKPSVYLRYRTKAELAARALSHARDRSVAAPIPTGDLAADLEAELAWFLTGVLRPNGLTLIGTVLAEQMEQPELMAAFREHVVTPRRARFRAVLDAAVERGALPAGAPVDEAVRALVGAVYAQALDGEPFDAGWPRRIVALIVAGLGAPATG